MPDDASQAQIVDRLIGLRLRQLQQATGMQAVFGGATSSSDMGRQLRIGHIRGTLGPSLLGLRVNPGRGLGGSAINSGQLKTVPDYASTNTITHDFDGIVVQQERISSIFALPLMIGLNVGGIVYGALRGPHPIGDAVLDRAITFGTNLEREVTAHLDPGLPPSGECRLARRAQAALDELDHLARTATDPRLREKLTRISHELKGTDDRDARSIVAKPSASPGLAPREIEALGLVAVGMSNGEVAHAMQLSKETVRAYLRSAMRRLDVHNRTAAVHAARQLGLLQC